MVSSSPFSDRAGAEAPGDAPPPVCPNCGADASGRYCAECGQRNEPLRQPIARFLSESFTEYFGLDGRLWRSLGPLLFHPGRLTNAYFAGRRARFLRPLRLYLTATLLFFFLLSVLDPVGQLQEVIHTGSEADTTAVVRERLEELDEAVAEALLAEATASRRVDSLRTLAESYVADSLAGGDGSARADVRRALVEAGLAEAEEELADLRGPSERQETRRLQWQRDVLARWPPDSVFDPSDLRAASLLLFTDDEENDFVGLPAWMPRSGSVERLEAARTDEEGISAVMDLLRATLGWLPTVMFLLLPVFALLLKVVYARREWYYSEHLVFGLHTHAFAFLVFAAVAALLGFSQGAGWARALSLLLSLSIPVYFYVAQKRVYGQGWVKTAVKALLLGWLYGLLVLIVGLTLAVVLAAVWG